MSKNIIVAHDLNRVIGNDGDMPWGRSMKSDLERFKRITRGSAVIMGRNTYESIGRPLPHRRNVVLSRNLGYIATGCEVVHSLDDAYELTENDNQFVIGGANLYEQALAETERIYITQIDARFEGDVFFPELDVEKWHLVARDEYTADTNNPHDSQFDVLHRVGSTTSDEDKVYFDHARRADQLADMENIAERGICYMCQDHIAEFYTDRDGMIAVGRYGFLVRNGYPYENTDHHLMFIPREHVKSLADLPEGFFSEAHKMFAAYEAAHEVTGGAIAMRFGNPAETGATAHHLHMHFIVPSSEISPNDKPVRFRMSPQFKK